MSDVAQTTDLRNFDVGGAPLLKTFRPFRAMIAHVQCFTDLPLLYIERLRFGAKSQRSGAIRDDWWDFREW